MFDGYIEELDVKDTETFFHNASSEQFCHQLKKLDDYSKNGDKKDESGYFHNKKIIITRTDYEILKAFYDTGRWYNGSIKSSEILRNLKKQGYFRLIDDDMNIADILDNCEIS